MQSDKFGQVYVYSKSPFDNSYANTIKFETEDEINSFFENSSLLTQIYYNDTCSWLRREGVLQVEGNQSIFETASYMRFKNEEGFTYYAFVIDTKYTNHGTTEIVFEVDVWNTYQVQFWGKNFAGFVEQITLPNFTNTTDEAGNKIRNVITTLQGFNVGNRKISSVTSVNLDIDWLVFVLLPSAQINSSDANGSAGFPATFKAFRYFVVPANLSTGRTLDYTYQGTLVRATSIASFVTSFTNLFSEGDVNTVNQCMNCYTTKHCGFEYTYEYDIVNIGDTNLTGEIIGTLTDNDSYTTSNSSTGIAGGSLNNSVNYTGGDLTYSGNTLSSDMIVQIILWCREYQLLPEAVIAQIHYEALWGDSNVAISDNNWSGITWNTSWTSPRYYSDINITVTIGSERPSGEGGNYVRFASATDWVAYHHWLLRPGNYYVCSGKTTVTAFGQGLFKLGGASADYATVGMATYVSALNSRATGIRSANGNDVIDAINALVYDTDSTSSSSSTNADAILDIARSQIGYIEKASNASLDDFTANAGSNNYTKYNRDMASVIGTGNGPSWPWCATFVSWCGYNGGMSQDAFPMSASCKTLIAAYKSMGAWYTSDPQPGDIALSNTSSFSHTGFVESVSGNTVVCIEGNYSNKCARVNRTLSSYEGYGRPNYTNASTSTNTTTNWVSNNIVEQLAGLKYLDNNLGTIFGDGSSLVSAALFSGIMGGPNLGAGTVYSPAEYADGYIEKPIEQDTFLGYAWKTDTRDWGQYWGPITIDDLSVGSILCIKGDGNMTIPASSETEAAYNAINGYVCVVKSKNVDTNQISCYCHNNIRGLFEWVFTYDADSINGSNTLPGDIAYNNSEYTSTGNSLTVDGTVTHIVTTVAAIEVKRLTSLYTDTKRIPDIFGLIDDAYVALLGSYYESQLLHSEFTIATMFDLYGNGYNFAPELLPAPETGEYQQDGENNDELVYIHGNHSVEVTGSLGDNNHIHYSIKDYNTIPLLEASISVEDKATGVYNNAKYAYGIKDINPRSITVISDATATYMQSQKNQHEAQLASFAEQREMLEMQASLNTAQTNLTNQQNTYSSDYTLAMSKLNLVSAGTGVVGGLLSSALGGAYGLATGLSSVVSGATNITSAYAGVKNAEVQQSFTQQDNSLRSQSTALANMQAKLALDQSIRSYNAGLKDLENQPDSLKQLGTDMSFQVGNNGDMIYIKIEIPNEEILRNANHYLQAYGTVVNRMSQDILSEVNARVKFNYVKCANIEIPDISINQSHFNTLKAVFVTGTRIWSNTDTIDADFMDFTITNYDN